MIYILLNKLKKYDFIDFGCTGEICTGNNGKSRPSNGAMGSRPYGILMGHVLKKFDSMVGTKKNFDYFELGKLVLWSEIKKLQKEKNYDYYHYDSAVDGSRDIHGNWIAKNLIFKNHLEIRQKDLYIVFLANSIYCGKDPKYNFFCNLSENDIMNGDFFISELFRKSLGE